MNSAPPPSSWNPWPIGIIAFFVVFIGITVGFVVFSLGQRTDLVAADYYQQELRHQDQMEREERTVAGGLEPKVEFDRLSNTVIVSLPAAHVGTQPTGSIHLYRPSAAELDQEIELAPDAEGRQRIAAADLADGPWQVRVEWAIGEARFAADRRLVIERRSAAR
ncbi:MAG: FixH family protein [Verrucomicrobiales bacterium]|nr:FixH family protein [Verrucomicrobiales bacterium]